MPRLPRPRAQRWSGSGPHCSGRDRKTRYPRPHMELVLVNFVRLLATVIWLLLIARVVLSWTNPGGGGGLVAFVYQATEPILAPIRRVLPPTGGIDWSPLIAMLLVGVVVRVVAAI